MGYIFLYIHEAKCILMIINPRQGRVHAGRIDYTV
jgi:hypothetical protein